MKNQEPHNRDKRRNAVLGCEHHAHLSIHGRVQGVGFRYYVQEEACERGLVGWVRNCPDGSVEAVIQGDKETLEKMIASIHQGPPLARVQRVDVDWRIADPEIKEFEIH